MSVSAEIPLLQFFFRQSGTDPNLTRTTMASLAARTSSKALKNVSRTVGRSTVSPLAASRSYSLLARSTVAAKPKTTFEVCQCG